MGNCSQYPLYMYIIACHNEIQKKKNDNKTREQKKTSLATRYLIAFNNISDTKLDWQYQFYSLPPHASVLFPIYSISFYVCWRCRFAVLQKQPTLTHIQWSLLPIHHKQLGSELVVRVDATVCLSVRLCDCLSLGVSAKLAREIPYCYVRNYSYSRNLLWLGYHYLVVACRRHPEYTTKIYLHLASCSELRFYTMTSS